MYLRYTLITKLSACGQTPVIYKRPRPHVRASFPKSQADSKRVRLKSGYIGAAHQLLRMRRLVTIRTAYIIIGNFVVLRCNTDLVENHYPGQFHRLSSLVLCGRLKRACFN